MILKLQKIEKLINSELSSKVKSSSIDNDELLIKKAWFSSSFIVVINHLSDITYYDGKVSILISLLFAGLKCIHDEIHNKVI